MSAQKVQSRLLVSGEELGCDGGNGHHLRVGEEGLLVVLVMEGFEHLVKEAVQGYNLVWHGRLLVQIGLGNRTLPESLPS